MARKVHPTLSTYQEKIVIGKAHIDGERPATIVKEIFGRGFVTLTETQRDIYISHYNNMTDEQKEYPQK